VNWTLTRRWAALAARLLLFAVWLLAGVNKIGSPRAFLRAVRAYDATPEWLSQAIAYGLPTLEIALAVVLLLGVATRYAATVSAVLFGVFLIGIVQASVRGIKLECGCFGGGGTTTQNTSYTLDIARDLGLLAVAVFLVLYPVSQFAVDQLLTEGHDVTPPSAKRVRRDPKAIQRYQAMRAARERQLRSRQRFLALTVGLAIALISVIGIGVQAGRSKIQGTLEATNASVSNGVVVGKATAPITVDEFEDFQCPICQSLETSLGTPLAKLVAAGTVKVNYHMMAFLDSSSNGNRYSSRAANAALCASDISPTVFQKFHAVLYGKDKSGKPVQPPENTNGRPDADFTTFLKQADPTASADQVSTFESCVSSEQHKALVQAITDDSSKRKVTGTPTVMVNGKVVANGTTSSAVLAAISAQQAKLKKS
jgi:protein-disulfide isomerase